MKFYGDANFLNKGEIQQANLQVETSFPSDPTPGRICFVNKIVYVCAEIASGTPVWIPLSNEIGSYVHVQELGSSTWNIVHPLNTKFILVQTFDGTGAMFIPHSITITDATHVSISMGANVAGRAVLVAGSLSGVRPPVTALEYSQTSPSSSWVINHDLGYQPTIRVFINNYEVQPASVLHNSANTVTLSFTTPQMGIAKLA